MGKYLSIITFDRFGTGQREDSLEKLKKFIPGPG